MSGRRRRSAEPAGAGYIPVVSGSVQAAVFVGLVETGLVSRDELSGLNGILDESPALRCSLRRSDATVIMTVTSELDLLTEPEFTRTLATVLADASGPVVLDLTGVTFLDSSGLNSLIRSAREATEAGTPLLVVPGPVVLRTARLAGAEELLPRVVAGAKLSPANDDGDRGGK